VNIYLQKLYKFVQHPRSPCTSIPQCRTCKKAKNCFSHFQYNNQLFWIYAPFYVHGNKRNWKGNWKTVCVVQNNNTINRKFRVATEIGSTFLVVGQLPGSWKSKIWFFIMSMKFPIDRIPSCPSLKFWDSSRIMAVGQNRLKIVNLDFFPIIMKFLNDRVPSCFILVIWDFGLGPD
jgi:hypothetical protein